MGRGKVTGEIIGKYEMRKKASCKMRRIKVVGVDITPLSPPSFASSDINTLPRKLLE